MKLVKCHSCNGLGKILLINKKTPFIDCPLCGGAGGHKINLFWQLAGKIMKDWRTRNEITLRDAARKYKIDPSNLSKMERGMMNPSIPLLKMIINGKGF